MQSNILQRAQQPAWAALSIKSNIGLVTQVRNHVKMYPWRKNRNARECYLDNTKTPYTDKHNMNDFKNKKQRKDWQVVIPKDKDNRFNVFQMNDAYKSNPAEAKETAQSRMARFQQSLKDRGSAREHEAYNPPENIDKRIISLYKAIHYQTQANSGESMNESDDDILGINLDQSRALKFNLIVKCIQEFKHDLPNSHLNDIESISDLVEYYSTPVRGVNPYTALMRNETSLPPNLALISEPIRFDSQSDTHFGGHSAFPGLISKVDGLRAAKKYPILNQDEFQWPDI